MHIFRKTNPSAPPGLFAAEAHGLRWLGAVSGGVPCARVHSFDETGLDIERLERVRPHADAARQFGRRLAVTHAAGADAFGSPPDGWSGPGYFGPAERPLPMSYGAYASWGAFLAEERLGPALDAAAPTLAAGTRRDVATVIDRARAGDYDDDATPSRLHGDLWNGNVLWTPRGVVLIDPAAHGAHHETDLAMLALFGCPHHDAVIEGYQEHRPLRPGWQVRRGLHQLYPLLMHVALFGAGYAASVTEATRSALAARG